MRLMTAVLVLAAASLSAQTITLKVIPPPADVAAVPADAIKEKSGLATKVLEPATGPSTAKDRPTRDDFVMVNYTGWTTDGKMFDSTISRGRPASFPVSRVIPGFTEALQLMVPGEKRRVWIPEALAYKGAEGRPKGTLVFDLELIDIPNRAPTDVKNPPADAMKTASGLAYKVLREGDGGRRPRATSSVTVHYTGWTTDGRMFDSSVVRGMPATFTLDGVIPGWTEGLQLMVENEKVRFWIPERLAYKGQSAPYGMLVFDVELLGIQ
jgi:peptidylprolyl isomerase